MTAFTETWHSFAGGTPDFMQKFLSDMQVSCEHARQEACRSLRDWGDELRESTLLKLGDCLFSELTARALAELSQVAQESHQATVQLWIENDKKRAAHEHRESLMFRNLFLCLNPRLADANKSAELQELVEAEAQRQADAVEPPRMSIKRRMRRLNNEEEKAPEPVPKAAAKGKAAAKPPEEEKDKDTGLPERQWQGIPKYELRALFLGDGWPEDPILGAEDEKQKELTDTLKSFRSHEAQKECRWRVVE
eukprot:Skav205264  [mRNA]  locus=scaffold1841:130764:134738:- [translate_table: standard]